MAALRKLSANQKLVVLCFLLVMLVVMGLFGGIVNISVRDLLNLMQQTELTKAARILLFIRLPRIMGAVIAGMGLAVSGAIIQVIFHNPMAGPNIIGVNAGAGLAVVLFGLWFPVQLMWLPLAAFLGALLTTLLVYFLGKRTGASRISLILSGIAVNSILTGFIDLVHSLHETSLLATNLFRIGGLSSVNIVVLLYAGLAVVVCYVAVISFHTELELFSLGEEKAKTLGLSISWYRLLFLTLAAALAGASISFAGLLGFIGLLIPHMARMLIGTETKAYLIGSGLLGSILLLLCDFAARTLFAPYEIQVGIILSFIGAPFFLWLLIQRRGSRNA